MNSQWEEGIFNHVVRGHVIGLLCKVDYVSAFNDGSVIGNLKQDLLGVSKGNFVRFTHTSNTVYMEAYNEALCQYNDRIEFRVLIHEPTIIGEKTKLS